MALGAVAMFDALGFRGIWRRLPPEQVLSSLKAIQVAATTHATRLPLEGPLRQHANLKVTASCISDTIVIAARAEKSDHQSSLEISAELAAVLTAVVGASEVLGEGAKHALAYRGAVAYGDFVIEENFFVGDAIDAAAEAMEIAEGAFVWLTPSAEKIFSAATKSVSLQPPVLIDYPVPIKGGHSLRTWVVSPFGTNPPPPGTPQTTSRADHWKDVYNGILAPFDRDPARIEVQIKRQHTEAFLQHALTLARQQTPP